MDPNSYSLAMIVLFLVAMYFLMIRPENKRKKQAREMREKLKKGDVITTIGGIVGKIVKVGDDTIVIETSEDRVRMEITKWAVSTVGVDKDASENKKNKKESAPASEESETLAAEASAEEK